MKGKGRIAAARAILAYTLKVFPNCRAAYLEQSHGIGCVAFVLGNFVIFDIDGRESREALLHCIVDHCPQADVLWGKEEMGRW